MVFPSTLLKTPAELVASTMIKLGDHIPLEFLGCSKFGNRIALARHNILSVFEAASKAGQLQGDTITSKTLSDLGKTRSFGAPTFSICNSVSIFNIVFTSERVPLTFLLNFSFVSLAIKVWCG